MSYQEEYEDYPASQPVKPLDWDTRQILLLDSSVQLSSAMARYILFHSANNSRSCALYHLGPQAHPRLTYYETGEASPNGRRRNGPSFTLNFAVFVAPSPRHALTWLEETPPPALTLLIDLGWRNEREAGLTQVIAALADTQTPSQIIFLVQEPPNPALTRPLAEGRKAGFVLKNSPDWQTLPRYLVETNSRPNYQVPLLADYAELVRPTPNPISPFVPRR